MFGKFLLILGLLTFCIVTHAEEVPVPHRNPIIGGSVAPNGVYPFMVALYDGGSHVCGASLIATDWVLTAAHCVVDESNVVVNPATLSVRLGVNDLSGGGGIYVGVSQVIVHPSWDTTSNNNDVALLQLSAQVTGVAIDSIRVVDQFDPDGIGAVGIVATASGWGNSGTQDDPVYDPEMLHVDLPILSNAEVNQAQYLNGQVFTTMLSAGSLDGGIDTCQGDSGGPLFVQRYGQFYQVGVTSWGIGCAAPGNPGVYARLSFYRNWIESHTGDLNDYPDLEMHVPSVASSGSTTITLRFSEDVTGVDVSDFSVTDGSLSNFQTIDAATYTVDYTAAASEGAEEIIFTPGTGVDVDDGRLVHYHAADILIDDEIANVTSSTGVIALGLSVASTNGPYSLAQLGLDGLSVKKYNPSSGSYVTVTELDGMEGVWIDASSALEIAAPTELTDVDTGIPLVSGWNFFSVPYHDSVNWDVTTIQVRLPNESLVSLQNARALGYIEDYAWWYNSDTDSLVPVNDPAIVTMPGSVSIIEPWKPYWIRAYQSVELILPAAPQPYPVFGYSVIAPGSYQRVPGVVHE